jgi:hypothetical protein
MDLLSLGLLAMLLRCIIALSENCSPFFHNGMFVAGLATCLRLVVHNSGSVLSW